MSAPIPPDATAAQRARRGAFRDSLRFAVVVLMVTNALSFYHFLRASLDDPRDFLVYNGSFGPTPFHDGMSDPAAAPVSFGPLQSVYHAGDRVAFTTNLCVAPNVGITGHSQLVRTPQRGLPESVVDGRTTAVPPTMHRCGPRLGTFRFPVDALPGTYEVRRWVDVDGDGSLVRRLWPIRINLEPIPLELVTTVNTAPVNPGPTPADEP